MSNTKLVRAQGLTDDELRQFKALAATRGVSMGLLVADALRALLKGGKP